MQHLWPQLFLKPVHEKKKVGDISEDLTLDFMVNNSSNPRGNQVTNKESLNENKKLFATLDHAENVLFVIKKGLIKCQNWKCILN